MVSAETVLLSTNLYTVPQYEHDASGLSAGASSRGIKTRGCESHNADEGAGQCIGSSSLVTSITACDFDGFIFSIYCNEFSVRFYLKGMTNNASHDVVICFVMVSSLSVIATTAGCCCNDCL